MSVMILMSARLNTSCLQRTGLSATDLNLSCKMRQNETNSNEETTTEREGRGVTPPQRRHHGLINQGATCYLNSVLQVLFMTTEIHHRLDPQADRELRQIFTDLKTETCRTENITRSLKIENVDEQGDAAECLKMILNKVSRQAAEVFKGEMTHRTECSEGHINERTKPFWTHTLSLRDTPDTTYSVESSFKRTFQTKTYSSGNMMHCNDCKQKTGATSRCEMVEAPQILILLLKRFDFDYITRSHFKSNRCVEVPCELQLETKTYKLYGMVNHMGSIRGGHYTATVLSEDNTWYECDDSHVSQVKHQLFAEDRTFSSSTVYLLMYRATELKMSCETRQNEEGDIQTRNGNGVLNHLTEGKEDNAEENSNINSEGLKETHSKTSCEQHLADKTEAERKEQNSKKNKLIFFFKRKYNSRNYPSERAASQKPVGTTSEDLTDEEKEEQGDDIGPAGLKGDEEPERNSKRNTDDEETTQLGHSAEDDGQMRKDRKEERLQARATSKCSKCHTITEETKTICILLPPGKDSHDTTHSEESSLKKIVNTKSFAGDNNRSCDKKMETTSSSAKKMITEHKVELINCLMADHSYILQHSHSKQIITDRQYFNIKEKSPSTPQETVIDLIDHVILNGQKSCTLLLKVLKLPEVLSNYPQLKEILNEMQLSNGGSNA
ncbi:uncharacterized protein AB9X84_015732 isoform 2-T2 [Acanthopagrus schlegelii]